MGDDNVLLANHLALCIPNFFYLQGKPFRGLIKVVRHFVHAIGHKSIKAGIQVYSGLHGLNFCIRLNFSIMNRGYFFLNPGKLGLLFVHSGGQPRFLPGQGLQIFRCRVQGGMLLL